MGKRWVVAAVGATLVAAVAAGGALVVRSGDDTGPAALKVSPNSGASGGGAAPASLEAASADRSALWAPYYREEYVLGGELPALDDDAPAWSSVPRTITADDAARLAAALGVVGEPVLQDWGAYTVGPQDGSGPTLNLTITGLGDWFFSNPTSGPKYACAFSTALVDPGTVSNDPAVSGPALSEPPVMSDECTEPEPPTDLLSDDQALAEAARIADAVGVTGEFSEQVTRDDWGVSVDRRVLVGGLEAPVWTSFRFGSGGTLEYANGILGSFEEAGSYPRIGTAAAFANLQAGKPFPWIDPAAISAYAADTPMARDAAVEAATEPAVNDASAAAADSGSGGAGGGMAGSDGSAVAPAPAPVDPSALVGPTPDGSVPEITAVDPAVVPQEPEVRTVTIVSVEPTLVSVPGADGGILLVPAYRFVSSEGGEYDVVAVPEDLVEVVAPQTVAPQPVPVPEPAPLPVETAPVPVPEDPTTTTPVPATLLPSTVPGETLPDISTPPSGSNAGEPSVEATVPDPAIAAAYVGLTEGEALRKAETEGRPARVSSRDGEEFALTADYVDNRVNLVVVAGLVTGAKLG